MIVGGAVPAARTQEHEGEPCGKTTFMQLHRATKDVACVVRQTAVWLCMEDHIMPAAINTARLEARISTDLHAMLKRAAELQGRSMTDFVVSAVQDAAQRAIEQSEVIRLSLADQECFAQALLAPPPPSPALKRAFDRRSKLLRTE